MFPRSTSPMKLWCRSAFSASFSCVNPARVRQERIVSPRTRRCGFRCDTQHEGTETLPLHPPSILCFRLHWEADGLEMLSHGVRTTHRMTEEHFERLLCLLWNNPEGEELRRTGDRLRMRLARYLARDMQRGNSIDMNTHTDRMNRLLLLWLDLQKAMAREARGTGEASSHATKSTMDAVPWNSADEDVRRLWEKITDPKNHRALEEWLYQSASRETELWAQQALAECRRRSG
jgi:hypothetical protein